MVKKQKIQFDIITIYPECFQSYLSCAIFNKAIKLGIVKIKIHNLRDWTSDKHRSVDDSPYGGGPGMLMKINPIFECLKDIVGQPLKSKRTNKKIKVIVFTPKGKVYTQKMAAKFSKLDRIIMICGRYEGIDERVIKYLADMNVSIGNYVLSGGEIPALVIMESVTRLLPGVLGASESLKEESFVPCSDYLEYPQYTRPSIFYPNKKNKKISWKVPKVLLSGDHKKINTFRHKDIKLSKHTFGQKTKQLNTK